MNQTTTFGTATLVLPRSIGAGERYILIGQGPAHLYSYAHYYGPRGLDAGLGAKDRSVRFESAENLRETAEMLATAYSGVPGWTFTAEPA
jgi:hypothetical protein